MISVLVHIWYTSGTLQLIGTMCNNNNPICWSSGRHGGCPYARKCSALYLREQCSVP